MAVEHITMHLNLDQAQFNIHFSSFVLFIIHVK